MSKALTSSDHRAILRLLLEISDPCTHTVVSQAQALRDTMKSVEMDSVLYVAAEVALEHLESHPEYQKIAGEPKHAQALADMVGVYASRMEGVRREDEGPVAAFNVLTRSARARGSLPAAALIFSFGDFFASGELERKVLLRLGKL